MPSCSEARGARWGSGALAPHIRAPLPHVLPRCPAGQRQHDPLKQRRYSTPRPDCPAFRNGGAMAPALHPSGRPRRHNHDTTMARRPRPCKA
jgi:hypothetical protein